ncbi:hypothetical protein BJ912DRAFT_976030 [Pholiota molesta]|nr:hypothetical protein BJ912DRAFT_976030 [Pholiota molesta]
MGHYRNTPPEILASIFELGIYSCVCTTWRDIINTTPRLWGIIILEKNTPARIFKSKSRRRRLPHYLNWVSADVSTEHLLSSNLDTYHNLEYLRLSCRGNPGEFSMISQTHSFDAINLNRSWITPFLGPSIKRFRLQQKGIRSENMDDLECYLSRIPQISTLELDHLHFTSLCTISAFSKITLISTWSAFIPMTPLLVQWSQPGITPTNLHTLELINCLQPGDLPYLIRWLGRLPNLVSLWIKDDRNRESESTQHFFDALSYPQPTENGKAMWLCPSLTILHVEMVDQKLADLIPIARSRGRNASPICDISPPKQLRRVVAQICPESIDATEERVLFDSFIEQPYCICLSSGLGLGCCGTPFA